MRIQTEALIRGELMALELTELDFCPECCGTLQIVGAPPRAYLKCASCHLVFRPSAPEPREQA